MFRDLIESEKKILKIYVPPTPLSPTSSPSFYAATTIVEAGKDKKNPDDFAEALDSVLGDFAFPDVFLFDVWGALGDVKNGRI